MMIPFRILVSTLLLAIASTQASASFQDRDINGDGYVDAHYDPVLNFTYLDASVYVREYDPNFPDIEITRKNFADAMTWADNISYGGYTDWRLPTLDRSCMALSRCFESEFGTLYLSNILPAKSGGVYWTSMLNETSSAPGRYAWGYNLAEGVVHRSVDVSTLQFFIAVRTGDVTPVPEPETYGMLLLGLGVLGAMGRRRSATSR